MTGVRVMRMIPRAVWERLVFPRVGGLRVQVAFGVGAALVAILIERLVWPFIPNDRGAVAMATLAVLGATVFGGFWAGVLATGLLALSIGNLWVPGHGGPLDDAAWKRHLLAVLFVGVGLTCCWLAEWPRRFWLQARGSEYRFRRMFEESPLGVALVAPDHRIGAANAAFGHMFGYAPAEMVGRTFDELTHPDDLRADVELFERVLAGEIHHYRLAKRYYRRDGSVFWGELHVAVVRDDQGRMDYALGMVQDVTGRMEMQASLERAKGEAEVARGHAEAARDQAEAARAAAEAAGRAKDQFLAVLSHELRTPLSPVLLTASALEADPSVSGAVREGVRTIRQGAELEARLIDDLLDVTGIARGKLSLRRERVDAHALIGQAMYMVEREATAKRLRLRADLRASCADVDADATRLQQVFWTLLGNAVKFTPEGGDVTVRTACEPDGAEAGWLVVEVRDSGEGIAADVLPRLFRAFEQGTSRRTRQFGGLGLGLAIARSIVELHGGRIEAASEGLGRGATFTVRLPLAPVGAAAAAGRPSEAPASRPATSRAAVGRRLRVLLVEDHPATRRAMAAIVASLGHEVRAVGSLAEAMAVAEGGEVDFVMSDLALPDGSGHDLMRRLKERRRDLHGVAVSGYGMEDDVRRSREAGFDEHLTKPVSRERIREALSHVGGEGQESGDRSQKSEEGPGIRIPGLGRRATGGD